MAGVRTGDGESKQVCTCVMSSMFVCEYAHASTRMLLISFTQVTCQKPVALEVGFNQILHHRKYGHVNYKRVRGWW